MSDWEYAEKAPSEQLARLHFFSFVKHQDSADVEFRITIREFATPQGDGMRYLAEADKQTNQNTAPYTPCGWGNTLLVALEQCIRAIQRFPYEGE